jgi:dihydrofolate reductase
VPQPLRPGINVTLDGCRSHEKGLPLDEESMAFWSDELRRSDTLLYGRVNYELVEGAWRRPAPREWPDWTDDSEVVLAEVMDPMRKVVASTTLVAVDWNAELLHGDLIDAVRRLKEQPGRGILVGGVRLRVALAARGLIDE